MTVPARKAVQRHAREMLAAVPPRRRGSVTRVLRELAFAAVDDEGHGALLRQEELAKRADCDRRTAQRALDELEELDLIRRHRGDRDHCPQCARARRGMVVYDVVLPAMAEQLHPGQQSLLTGVMTSVTVTPVAGDDQRRDDAGSGVITTLLNTSTNRSTANNPSLKGSPSISNAPSHQPVFDFRTAGTDRAGARAGAGRSRGRRGSRSSSDRSVESFVRVAAPTPCVLRGRDLSEIVELFELWTPIANHLQGAVAESTWNIWLAELHPHDLLGDRLVIGAPETTAMWVNSRFGRLIREWSSLALDRRVGVEVTSCLGAPALDLPRAAA